jgi:tetratricopeptide (TPR) repeat protein
VRIIEPRTPERSGGSRFGLAIKLASAVLFAIGALGSTARADTPPNIWDLAKNPDAFEQRREHLRLEENLELLDTLKEIGGRTRDAFRAAALAGAQNVLDDAKAPKDKWLRYDEAVVAMYRADILGSMKEYERAIELLEPLAKEFEGTLFDAEIWQKLAECYVRVERTPDEIRAYDEVIKRAVVAEGTATPLLNQSEAYMRNGDVDVAVTQLREVYRLAGTMPNGNELGVLAQWDLAVALDRSGDARGAIAAARSAIHMDARCLAVSTMHTVKIYPTCKDADIAFVLVPAGLFPVSEENDTVYFVPKYERNWYMALGREALALDGDKPREIAENWKRAETEMMTYMTSAAQHGGDKWVDLAKKRLDEIRKHRLEADKRAGVSPKEDVDVGL